ncbi:polysaccharide deacetylase family protein [Aquimarina sp. LLG6339-5]|uniref:polysaccharide deacetylase family protein n=1 Tax=Aquimarina sp. LLG6339-5 TaxID=3160830 RepID=UPI003867E741
MNILTFDIEEWFHILDNKSTKTEKEWTNYESRIYQNMDRVFQILQNNDVKATFFCLGWIAEKYPNIIRKIDDLGYEIGTHSHMHQLAYEMDKTGFEEDLKRSIFTLEDNIGKKIKTYRAPGFSITKNNLWAFEILNKLGIENDCSIFPANRAHGGISSFTESTPCIIEYNGVQLKEFPINTSSILGKEIIFSGGGYFRVMPYPMIKRMTSNSNYVMTYFHPRDFDYDQPMIEGLSWFRKFKSYHGLKSCERKLIRWINDFDFMDLETCRNKVDWNSVPVVSLD